MTLCVTQTVGYYSLYKFCDGHDLYQPYYYVPPMMKKHERVLKCWGKQLVTVCPENNIPSSSYSHGNNMTKLSYMHVKECFVLPLFIIKKVRLFIDLIRDKVSLKKVRRSLTPLNLLSITCKSTRHRVTETSSLSLDNDEGQVPVSKNIICVSSDSQGQTAANLQLK